MNLTHCENFSAQIGVKVSISSFPEITRGFLPCESADTGLIEGRPKTTQIRTAETSRWPRIHELARHSFKKPTLFPHNAIESVWNSRHFASSTKQNFGLTLAENQLRMSSISAKSEHDSALIAKSFTNN